jgi:hypothetical protein
MPKYQAVKILTIERVFAQSNASENSSKAFEIVSKASEMPSNTSEIVSNASEIVPKTNNPSSNAGVRTKGCIKNKETVYQILTIILSGRHILSPSLTPKAVKNSGTFERVPITRYLAGECSSLRT